MVYMRMLAAGGFLQFGSPVVATAATLKVAASGSAGPSRYPVRINRTHFPRDFVFGAGSSAYQYEGAVDIEGKGPSIWDTFIKHHPEKIRDHSTADMALDFYHRYKTDIHLMRKMGLDSFRFSISWPRLFPDGWGKVNDLGVKFYNNVIDEVLANGLIPFVTLFHWDVPQALEDEYGGFLSPKIVDDFQEFANFCFKTFGDRVKNWVTINEPSIFTLHGYNLGTMAPGRCSKYVGNCTAGNSAIEPYLVTHHLLLSHAAVVRLYRTKYQAAQEGKIGITLTTSWMVPKYETEANRKAANRALDFYFGWHANPITYGEYPEIMRYIVGDRLPKFTKSESEMLKGSYDFLGINYYTANYAENSNNSICTVNKSFTSDTQVTLSTETNGVPIGTPTDLTWLYICPEGLYQLLLHVKDKYKNPPIYITENGIATANDASKPVLEAIQDNIRREYHERHIRSLLHAIKDGVNVQGYYAWTFLDDFEWASGYTVRFGLTYIDFKNNLDRRLKHSADWFKEFLLG